MDHRIKIWSRLIFLYFFFFLITWGKSWKKISEIRLHVEILIRKLCVYNLGLRYFNILFVKVSRVFGTSKVYFSEFC